MTVFPDGTKERMHGHHYQVALEIGVRGAKLKDMVAFQVIKDSAREICETWDEHLLIAAKCRFFRRFSAGKGQYAFELCGKAYSLPAEDVVELATENITTEGLAEVFLGELRARLRKSRTLPKLKSIGVIIEESPGQGAQTIAEL